MKKRVRTVPVAPPKRWLLSRKSLAIASALAALAILATIGSSYRWRSPPGRVPAPTPASTFDPPPLSASSFQNTAPAVTYVGITACAECHADEYHSYLQTAHSEALADLNPAVEPADGTFEQQLSGRTYTSYRESGRLRHREAARDVSGVEYAVADYPIRYLVGSGRHTRSYLVETDGFLTESPLTWYASKHAWDMSPGYDRANHRGFERAADATCLYCHVGRMSTPDSNYQRLTITEQAIGCERCHGPGSLHVDRERAKSRGTLPKEDSTTATIVQPKRLSRPLREAICSQCHLNIDTAVIVRGRSMNDFRPGLPLSDFCINYGLKEPDLQMKVVGHVGQLHLSRCYRESDSLTCTTCHDPHTSAQPEQKRVHYLQACAKCHAENGCRLEAGERLRRNPKNDCLACHMPQVGTDIPHIAFTHHRIGIHEGPASESSSVHANRASELVPFDDVSGIAAIDQERNLGLAYFGLAQRQSDPEVAEVYRRRGQDLLDRVHARGLADAEVSAALARLLQERDPDIALGLADEALAGEKLAPKSRINCLFLTAEVGLKRNRLALARQALERLVAERLLSQDWLLLGICRQREQNLSGAVQALQKAASLAPFRAEIHETLATVHDQQGNTDAARTERAIAGRLAQQPAVKH